MTRHALSLLTLLALVGCDDHTEGAARAVVTEGPDESPPDEAPPEAEAATLTIDASRSTLGFVGAKVTHSQEGSFSDWSGTMELADEVEASAVSITIQTASVQTESERLSGHLRSDDFFDADHHPTATFESTGLAPTEAEDANYLVTGRLTLRGQTRTITFPAQIDVSESEVRARARFTIDRQQFGVSYRGAADDLIADEVVIHFDVRAPRA